MGKDVKIKGKITPFTFFFAIILPLLVFFTVYKISTLKKGNAEGKSPKKAFSVKIPGTSFRVFDETKLNPQKGNDFVLTLWVKFRKLPKEDGRIVLLTKYDASTAYKQGYAVAIDKKSTGFRGSVFWQDMNNNGRWYTFDEIPIIVGNWFMFTISFTSNEHLAFHYTYSIGEKVFTKLIGAYKISAIPASVSSFRVGSLVSQIFDGKIGTVSLIKTSNVEENLNDIIKENFMNSQRPSKRFKKEEILLWVIAGREDIGQYKFPVKRIGKATKEDQESDLDADK